MHDAHPENPLKVRQIRLAVVAWGVALALGGVTAACDGASDAGVTVTAVEHPRSAASSPPVDSVDSVDRADSGTADGASEPTTLGGPPTGLTPPDPGEERLVGTVVEHLPTGNYHYLRITPEQGESRWVVTMGGEYREGVRVAVSNLGARADFYSRRLDRRFAELVFGMVDVVG